MSPRHQLDAGSPTARAALLLALSLVALTTPGCRGCSKKPPQSAPAPQQSPPTPAVEPAKEATASAAPSAKPSNVSARAVQPPRPVTPAMQVRSRADGSRLIARVLPPLRRYARDRVGDAWVFARVHDGAQMLHTVTADDEGIRVTLATLGIAYHLRGPRCSVAAAQGGVRGRCSDDEAGTVSALAGLYATLRLAAGPLDDAQVEAVGLDRNDAPHVRLSSRLLGTRWWIHADATTSRVAAVAVAARGMMVQLNAKGGAWSMRLGERAAGTWRVFSGPIDAAAGHRTWLQTDLAEGGEGDPLDAAGQRLFALANHRGLVQAGPLGLLVDWTAGSFKVRGALLPVLGAPPQAHAGPASAPSQRASVAVDGHALGKALAQASVEDGRVVVLILNATEQPPPRGVIAVLPVAAPSAADGP